MWTGRVDHCQVCAKSLVVVQWRGDDLIDGAPAYSPLRAIMMALNIEHAMNIFRLFNR